MITYRIRKSVTGSMDKYLCCDDNGTPLWGIFDKKRLKETIEGLEFSGDSVIQELSKKPNLDGLYGDTDIEKVNYALWLYENRVRNAKVFGYARVSTAGQAREGNSLEAQIAALQDAGAEEIYKDVYTGTKIDRPEFDKLLKILRNGDTLIVTKLDRIARSVTQGSKLIEDLVNKGVKIKILAMGDAPMDNTPNGRLMLHILMSFAEFERDMIVQRTQEGKEIAKKKPGFHEGRPEKYSKEQVEHALSLLQDHSYSEVVKITGISKATLVRMKKKYNTTSDLNHNAV